MLELIINDISSSDHGLCLFERPNIPTPERDVEQKFIRNRHGSLTKKYGYKDIEFPVTLNLMDEEMKPKLREIKAWLLNADRIQFSDDHMYYQVNFSRVGSIENEIAEYGLFDVTFNCKPFQYEDRQVQTITTTGTKIYNPGTVEALPRMSIYGVGEVTIDINGRDFIVTPAVTVDSELGYAYINLGGIYTPRDNVMAGELPYFDVGENIISWTGNVTSIDITYKAVYL